MKIVFISHPISGPIRDNLEHLRRAVMTINLHIPDVIPFVPYFCDMLALDDGDPIQALRMQINLAEFFKRKMIDEVWLLGRKITGIMEVHHVLADRFDIPVRHINTWDVYSELHINDVIKKIREIPIIPKIPILEKPESNGHE